uniref:Methyltransferase domain-containing protein n=1 Tax=Chromera velia CCMP2878 TaxID=1169474 RepID=A0A0G4HSU5_9ALVE|mmetsp:Transcript_24357/g.47817  ORF Transcript_24357/g.47817 Transcript_24357/m.47817 type:complete len:400 (-) Transcript_24357:95-1294(-)|eukprot:Cvel_8334.t1-p1 / transcript=Cvel_8334.t1 / gene=Cvel_8334 / organism=Chromera_velia_CCMP2878 / gene_product=hypothetical protein / transcript_product=hypothetical protein / location=Cvel_scaffold458:76452-78850(+) / protein_length=399 / sequence_SO=supercontig / SO=protein_coding / is_pseudo=false
MGSRGSARSFFRTPLGASALGVGVGCFLGSLRMTFAKEGKPAKCEGEGEWTAYPEQRKPRRLSITERLFHKVEKFRFKIAFDRVGSESLETINNCGYRYLPSGVTKAEATAQGKEEDPALSLAGAPVGEKKNRVIASDLLDDGEIGKSKQFIDPCPPPDLDAMFPFAKNTRAGAALYHHICTTGFMGERQNLVKGKRVLDVGCYLGGGAHYIAESLGASEVVAIDFLPSTIDQCHQIYSKEPLDKNKAEEKEEGIEWNPDKMQTLRDERRVYSPKTKFLLADALTLHEIFPPKSFDVIVCIDTVKSFASIPLFLEICRYLLKDDGLLLLSDMLGGEKVQQVHFFMERQFRNAGFDVAVAGDLSAGVRLAHWERFQRPYPYTGFHTAHYVALKAPELPQE